MVVLLATPLVFLFVSLWFITRRRFPLLVRIGGALVPWALVWTISPAGPIELINDGDLGVRTWRWRWTPKHDQRLAIPDSTGAAGGWQTTPHDYPRFLGSGFWAEVESVRLDADWEANPPRELWRCPIGAGWSSFAVVGNYAVTQEQRGEYEMVCCYRVNTGNAGGEVVWTYSEPVRWDPQGSACVSGIGPRATPTIHDGKVFAHGATGIVVCLDARSGKLLWRHDTLNEFGVENLAWGMATSPLVVDDNVVVSTAAPGRSLVAYDIQSGELAWAAGEHRASYASPVLCELAGVRQIVVVNENFVTAHDATSGEVIWEHPWPGGSNSNASASQPVPVGGDRLFLSKGYGIGSQLVQVALGDGKWSAKTLWARPTMKTKMGNVVVRNGLVFGLDDVAMQCIDLETGDQRWKHRRRPPFGHGQILLVGDEILVLTESGELALVEASGERYHELSTFPVFNPEQVTWNNPALSGPNLLIRNAVEAACYELPLVSPE